MDYEKKYKEALERAREFYNNEECRVGMTPVDLEDIFPELKESEDERIRKALITYFQNFPYVGIESAGTNAKEVLAWLEKQGEQKSVGKEELKFKAGDWVVRGDTIAQILDIQEQYYIGIDINGKDFTSSRFLNDDKIHFWSIQDAKDGDVLADEDNNIGIFQECVGMCWHSYIYLGCDGELRGFGIGGSHKQTNTHPATKIQRDTLFAKMKEANYKWDNGLLKSYHIEVSSYKRKLDLFNILNN